MGEGSHLLRFRSPLVMHRQQNAEIDLQINNLLWYSKHVG